MKTHMHPAFSNSADYTITSANPGVLADELVPLDKAIGWLVINRFTYRIMRALGRRTIPEFDRSGVVIEERADLGPGTLLVTPDEQKGSGALLLIHGGGFVIGSPKDVLPKATHFARTLGIPVVCSGYRLSPKVKAPAALQDCYQAWKGLLESAEKLSIEKDAIVIGGYSAGAGLAANLVNKLHDEGGIQPAAQLLVYPMLDDRTALRGELDKPRHRVWSNRNNRFAWTSFLGQALGRECQGYAAAARREDLAGLPPTWLGVGNCDLFLDEDRAYAQKLLDAGNDCTYVEVDGAIHGFDMGGTELANAFTASQMTFINRFAF